VFTYNDLPPGKTDPEMEHFSIEMEKVHLIPVLKEILSIFPQMKIMGSPWTPPVWMKTNNHSIGGSLKPEFYDAYALYFVKYIQAMQKEGIHIDAITVQNEPLHPGNNPSLLMKAHEQAAFIRQSLGPAFRDHDINTRIVIYDHNADRIDYPLEVLADEEARQYIDGTAFHLYGGKVEDISKVHEAYPDKNLYFTEQWVGHPQDFPNDMAWHVRELIVGATRNWCRNILEWNLAADPEQKPHTPGGCTRCLGAITIDGNEIERNVAYYIIAHASRFVRPGSVRIDSDVVRGLPNVAFTTPNNETVLIVLNDTRRTRDFGIVKGQDFIPAQLSPGALATYILK
jgi:glucosylceramidase